MKADQRIYDVFGAKLRMPGGIDATFALAWMLALYLSQFGTKLLKVAGDAITGVLSNADKTFTRNDGKFFVRSQILTLSNVVGTDDDETLRIGEGITQAVSGAKGIVRSVNPGETTTVIVVDTITVALFVSSQAITGDDSTVAADVDAVETKLLDLANQVAFAHMDGDTTRGEFVIIVSNDATSFTTNTAMFTGATAIVLFQDESAAAMAVDMGINNDMRPLPEFVAASAASVTLPGTDSRVTQNVLVNAAANAVNVALPDVRTVPEGHEIVFVGIDVETNAFTFTAVNAAQTLDGVDISAGGTPYAAMDANGDALAIMRSGGVWVTSRNAIA